MSSRAIRDWRAATDAMIAVPRWYRDFLCYLYVLTALFGVVLGFIIGWAAS